MIHALFWGIWRLSEQISTAGMEASGTGNMKFMLNGALTIGTLDGANVEIAEAVGKENMFLFGLQENQVHEMKSQGYSPQGAIESFESLQQVLGAIRNNLFSQSEMGIFDPLLKSLENEDRFMVCADFESYCKAQSQVSFNFRDTKSWMQKSILNVASSSQFSSDRTISDYAREIWKTIK